MRQPLFSHIVFVFYIHTSNTVFVFSCALTIFPEAFNEGKEGCVVLSLCPFVIACYMVASYFVSVIVALNDFAHLVCKDV